MRVRDLRTGDDLDDVIPETTYGIGVGGRHDVLLRAPRRDDAPAPGVAPRGRHAPPTTTCSCTRTPTSASSSSVGLSLTEEWVHVTSASKVTSEEHVIPAADPTRAPRVIQPREQGVEYDATHAPTPGRGPLRDPHQRRRRGELQARHRARRRPGSRALGGARRPPARREARGRVGLRRPPRALRASRGRAAHRRDALRRRHRARAGHARGGVRHRPGHQRRVHHHHAPLHLHLARHAGHRVRRGPRHRRAHAPQDHRGDRRPRPGRLRHRPAVGHRTRRQRGCRSPTCTGPTSPATARRRACSTATAPTRRASTRASRSCACRCSTAASCSPSPTCAAAARWAGPGTTTASSSTSATRSPTSSPCAEHLVAERLHGPRPPRGARRVGRRAAHGRHHQPAARPVRGGRGRGALRRLPHHDPRRDASRSPSPSGRSGATPSTDEAVYDYMAGYSPYDNVTEQAYPTILATGGLNDPRVLVLGAGQVGAQAPRVAPRAAGRSTSRPRWAPATRARAAATTRGRTRRSCSPSSSTPSAGR